MVRVIFDGQVFCQLVDLCTEQGSTEFRTPLCVILATPLESGKITAPTYTSGDRNLGELEGSGVSS